ENTTRHVRPQGRGPLERDPLQVNDVADAITILATFGALATKTVGSGPDGRPAVLRGHGNAKWFRCATALVTSLGDLHALRLHLWFQLSRPITSGQARVWLRDSPVDRTIYTPVQAHYTADPVFIDGVRDPVRRRRGLRRGLEDLVEVPDGLEETPAPKIAPV